MSRECRPQSVVKVAPESAPFLLPSEDESLDRPLEIGPEAAGVKHTAEVSGEIIEQAAISGAQRSGGRAVSKGADRFAVRRQGESQAVDVRVE